MFTAMSPHPKKAIVVLISVVVGLLIGCTAQSTVASLQLRFPAHAADLKEIRLLAWELEVSGRPFSILAPAAWGKEELVSFFTKDGEKVTLTSALTTHFIGKEIQVRRLTELLHKVGIDILTVDRARRAVWVVTHGGGAIGSDQGYVFVSDGNVGRLHLDYSLPIPSETQWYAFMG